MYSTDTQHSDNNDDHFSAHWILFKNLPIVLFVCFFSNSKFSAKVDESSVYSMNAKKCKKTQTACKQKFAFYLLLSNNNTHIKSPFVYLLCTEKFQLFSNKLQQKLFELYTIFTNRVYLHVISIYYMSKSPLVASVIDLQYLLIFLINFFRLLQLYDYDKCSFSNKIFFEIMCQINDFTPRDSYNIL